MGQLVAGIAHEINNPVGCIHGNVQYVEEYIKDLLEIINLYQQHYPQPAIAIQEKLDAVELDCLREDLPKLVESLQESVHRIRHISTSLRTFCRDDRDRPVFYKSLVKSLLKNIMGALILIRLHNRLQSL